MKRLAPLTCIIILNGCISTKPGTPGQPTEPPLYVARPTATAPLIKVDPPVTRQLKAPIHKPKLTYLTTAAASTADAAYAEGDQAFLERNNPQRAHQALLRFREYHNNNPIDAEAAWRHAMGAYFAGLHLVKAEDEKLALFEEGQAAGLSALRLRPNCAPCHFWTAINMALYGQTKGVVRMYFSLEQIQEHLTSSAKLDPKYAGAGAFRLLGLIQQKLPGMLGGNNDTAKHFFAEAIRAAPEEPLNYLVMTKLLSEKYNDVENAKKTAEKGLNCPEPSPDRIESRGSLIELRTFLDKHH